MTDWLKQANIEHDAWTQCESRNLQLSKEVISREQWIRKTALVIQTAIRNVDANDHHLRLLSADDRTALGGCLDDLANIEGNFRPEGPPQREGEGRG